MLRILFVHFGIFQMYVWEKVDSAQNCVQFKGTFLRDFGVLFYFIGYIDIKFSLRPDQASFPLISDKNLVFKLEFCD
jgi:hypothetical protein